MEVSIALKKEIIDNKGINCSYHKINEVNFNAQSEEIRILIDHYINQQYRDIEKTNKSQLEEIQKKQEELKKLMQENDENNSAIIQERQLELNEFYYNYEKK